MPGAEAILLCDHCGTHVADGSAACADCGQALSPGGRRPTADNPAPRKGSHGAGKGTPVVRAKRAGAGEGIRRLLRLALVGIGTGALGTYAALSVLRAPTTVAKTPRPAPPSSDRAPPSSPPAPKLHPAKDAIDPGHIAPTGRSEPEKEVRTEALSIAEEAPATPQRPEAGRTAQRPDLAPRPEETPAAAGSSRPSDRKKPAIVATPEALEAQGRKTQSRVSSNADEEKGRAPARPPATIVTALSPRLASSRCPDDMRFVPAGHFQMGSPRDDPAMVDEKPLTTVEVQAYCIDLFEYPNAAGSMPVVRVNYSSAEASCESQGKRLCTEEEWERACKGPGDALYPYGDAFDPAACNTRGARDEARPLAPSGAFARCRSGYGVADLSGNAAEWTSSRFVSGATERAVKGGASDRSASDARCAARKGTRPGGTRVRLGFRCCAVPG